MNKKVILTTLALLFGLSGISTLLAQSKAGNKPNILVILTDDQSYETIHALGNKEIVTPNMDLLVKNGTTFTQAHIMGGLSGAICCPSRAMLMSSRSLFHLRKDGQYIPASDRTFPELFRAKGYTTFATGKWHQDKATFNRSFSEGDNIFFGGMLRPDRGGQYRPELNHYDSSGQYQQPFFGDDFSSVYFADAAIGFLKKQQESENPFLMYVAFTSPHDPRTPPSWYGHSYRPDEISLPLNFLPEHPFDNGELRIRDETLLPFPRTKAAVKEEMAKYYSMVSEADYQIGRILAMLKKTGKDKNTIVVFAGDNGLSVGQHGLMGKQNPYESAIRVPLVFTGPGIPKNKRVAEYVYLNDIYPTLCHLTGTPVPATVEGKSMGAAFGNGPFKGRDQVFFAYLNLQRAVVENGFKLVLYNVNGQSHTQLFNLKEDHFELHNLAEKSEFKAKVEAMTALLNTTMKQLDDFCDLDKPGWGHPRKWTSDESVDHISTTQPSIQHRDASVYNWLDRHQQVLNLIKASKPKIVFLGNSIIHYWGGVPEASIKRGSDSWDKYFKPKDAINLGFGWDRIENVLWRIYHGELDGYQASTIVLLIGTNNLSVNTDEEIITGLSLLLDQVKSRQPKAKVLLMGLLPRKNFEARIAGLNEVILKLAKLQKVDYLSADQLFLHSNGKINEALFSKDGVHPNAEGYNLLAPLIGSRL
jgi:arylsulfatase A-like enzyme/lysophospholipase L1-like esterase